MFETNYEEKNNPLPEGDYECIIKAAFINATNSRTPTEYFSVRFVVRNDVPQKCQNKNIFHAIWRKKPEKQTADDQKVDGFSYKQLMNLCEGTGVPKGKSFKDLNELGEYLKGRCCIVHIVHDEWQSKKQEKVAWTNKTKYPECKHFFAVSGNVNANTDTTATKMMDVTDYEDEDLPFD